ASRRHRGRSPRVGRRRPAGPPRPPRATAGAAGTAGDAHALHLVGGKLDVFAKGPEVDGPDARRNDAAANVGREVMPLVEAPEDGNRGCPEQLAAELPVRVEADGPP